MVGLLFGKRYPKTKIGSVEFDATIAENHDYSSTITQFPVENGGVISDHIFKQPIRLTLEVLASDSPLTNSPNPFVVAANNVSTFFSFNSSSTRSNAIYEDLLRLYENRQIFTVVSRLRLYKNMAITSISIPVDSGTGQGLRFRIEMMQVIFATTLEVNYQYTRLIESQIPPTTRDQLASNADFPLFQYDPPDSFKDQGQSFIDVGTQTLQPLKQTVIAQAQEVIDILANSGIYRVA